MKPARPVRSPREPRTPRAPRAPRSALYASGFALPAVGSRWHMVRQSGAGVIETDAGTPQEFVVLGASEVTGQPVVHYARSGRGDVTRINLTAFRNRFFPAA